MNLTKITAVALTVLLVGAGAAAAIPGQAANQAGDAADGNATDAPAVEDPDPPASMVDGNGSAENVSGEAPESGDAPNASDDAGPSADLPEQVPDHVTEIHETIDSWLDGDSEGSLGDAISDIVGGDADDGSDEGATDADDHSDDATGTATDGEQ